MKSPQSRPPSPPGPADRAAARERRGSLLPALLGGLPMSAAVLGAIHLTPLHSTAVGQYLNHPVECVEVTMFCCALAALAAKLWQSLRERRAGRQELLPIWDGRPVPIVEANRLLAGLSRLPAPVQSTLLCKRVSAVLDFLCRRGSAADLDDHLRALADTDAIAQDSSYSLVRFITWAIPILGFLGTVLGITGAISGVTPEKLENDLNQVTDGLALAFNATALALALTMVTMFLTFVVERLEQGILEQVERFIDRHLAHRFERVSGAGSEMADVVRQNSTVLLAAMEQLVRQQAEVWARTLEEVAYRRNEEDKHQQQRIALELEGAMERTLRSHAQQVAGLQEVAVEGSTRLLEQLANLATTVQQTGQQQQSALVRVAEVIGELQTGEKQLVRLQDTLNQNLAALSAAQTFEQALHSLTAAVHLLTARAGGETRPSRLGTRGPGTAA